MGKRIVKWALAIGVAAMSVMGAASPASAHVYKIFLGNRGQMWTNTAHTRFAVQDDLSDGYYVIGYAIDAGGFGYSLYDDNDPGYSATNTTYEIVVIQLCAYDADTDVLYTCTDEKYVS